MSMTSAPLPPALARAHTPPLACQLCIARLATYIATLRAARAGRAFKAREPRA